MTLAVVLLYMFITSWFSVTAAGPLSLDTHLRLVREVTWPVRADWYSLGEQLGVPEETRKVPKSVHSRVCIEQSYCHDLQILHRPSMRTIFMPEILWTCVSVLY